MDSGHLVTLPAVYVTPVAKVLADANVNRLGVLIFNNGSETIFVGDSTVTVETGLPIKAGASITLDECRSAVYGVTVSATVNVRVAQIA
jgi:hypothetical protein